MSNLPLSEMFLKAAEDWVDLENAASILEETKSSVFSQMMLKYTTLPVNRAEIQVKASQEWDTHIKKMTEARRKANRAKVYLEYLRMKGWENTSREATERLQARI